MKRAFQWVVAIVAGVALVATASATESKPNIIFIFADDWGWGDLSCHGSEFLKTPNLDKLASEGTDFLCYNVNNPVCSPSRAALLTGEYPVRNRIYQHFGPLEPTHKRQMPDCLDPKVTTVPRLLKTAGYTTGHFGKWHLCASDLKDAPTPKKYGYDEYAVYSEPFASISDATDATFAKSVDFIKRNAGKPFFMNVWIHQAHVPHYPKQEWLDRFKDLDEQHRVYAAIIAEADYGIGQIIKTLKELNIDNNTIVFFSSDNGPERTVEKSKKKREGLGLYYSVGSTGGRRGWKRSLFEGGVGVPFICRWPGKIPAGKINKTSVVSSVDILPTLCSIAKVKLPATYKPDGENVSDILLGSDRKRKRALFWEWTGSAKNDAWPRFAVRDGDWKLVMVSPDNRVELYNVAEDIAEKNNLADKYPEKREELLKKLEDWMNEIPGKGAEHRDSATSL